MKKHAKNWKTKDISREKIPNNENVCSCNGQKWNKRRLDGKIAQIFQKRQHHEKITDGGLQHGKNDTNDNEYDMDDINVKLFTRRIDAIEKL